MTIMSIRRSKLLDALSAAVKINAVTLLKGLVGLGKFNRPVATLSLQLN